MGWLENVPIVPIETAFLWACNLQCRGNPYGGSMMVYTVEFLHWWYPEAVERIKKVMEADD